MSKSKKVQKSWTFDLRGRTWTVQLASKEEIAKATMLATGEDTLPSEIKVRGVCYDDLDLIQVNENVVGMPGLKRTLGHEIAHAVLMILAQAENYSDEVLADVIGEVLIDLAFEITSKLPKGWLND